MFHDLGNSPATFEASRWADFLGCVEGWEVQVADAIQAYIQAYIQGPALWVELPKEGWPEDGSWNKFRLPCVRMVKALYGHPDAGTFWEEHCHKGVTAVGFEPVGAAWPSVYVHKELNLLLVVYVDDFTRGRLARKHFSPGAHPAAETPFYIAAASVSARGDAQCVWSHESSISSSYERKHGSARSHIFTSVKTRRVKLVKLETNSSKRKSNQ